MDPSPALRQSSHLSYERTNIQMVVDWSGRFLRFVAAELAAEMGRTTAARQLDSLGEEEGEKRIEKKE